MDYRELVVELRRTDQVWKDASKHYELMREAADAIEELEKKMLDWQAVADEHGEAYQHWFHEYQKLLHAAKKMHTWIFLHSYDEQEAYDECGLSDEMNAELGYGGRLVGSVVPPTPEDQYPPMPAGGQMEEEAE